MGDHADDLLDNCEDFEYNRSLYRTGALSDEDAYYRGIIDETGAEPIAGHQEPVTCKYCKKKNLFWIEQSGKWLLSDGDGVHACPNQHLAKVMCNNCLEPGLYWKQVQGKWLLHNNDGVHDCPVKPLGVNKVRKPARRSEEE